MVKVLFKEPILLAVFFAAILVSAICGCSTDDDNQIYGNKAIEWSSSMEPVTNPDKVPMRQIPSQGGEYEVEATNVPIVYLYQASESKSWGDSSEKPVIYEPENKEYTSLATSFAEIKTEGRAVRIKIKANETGADRYLVVVARGGGFSYIGFLYFMQKGEK